MNSLIIDPVARVLKQLFQKAEAADRPLSEAFNSEGKDFSPGQFKTFLEDETKDYKAVYRTYAGNYPCPGGRNNFVAGNSLDGEFGGIYAFEVFLTTETNESLGTAFQGEWVGTGQAELLEFNITESTPLQVILNNLVSSNYAEIFVGFGQPPTPTSYYYSSTAPNSPNQQVIIPIATAGTWYVLVYGNNIQAPGGYTVTASAASVLLNSLTPNVTGTNAPSTFTISGAGFDGTSSVQFIDAGNDVYPATSSSVDSFTQITATEAAGLLSPGTYSVRVSLGSSATATLTNAIQVLSNGVANLVTSLTLPSAVGYHIPGTIYANYANTGGAAMPAPLLTLTATQAGVQGAILTLDSSLVVEGLWTSATLPPGFGHSVQFLASGQTPGVLQPGESNTVAIYYCGWQQPWNFSYPPINWNLSVIQANDSTPVNWPAMETNMQPSTIPTDAWNAIFMAFTNEVGSTMGDYVTAMDNDATYLGQLGLNVADLGKLTTFQIMQADGLCPLRSLASSVDASMPAPGLSLTFGRFFGEPISQRYTAGPFGRG